MAKKGAELDRESFSCCICLDLLENPVTLSCGHSYCMSCIQSHWDREDEKRVYSCPQCRQTFTLRPSLLRNTMLEIVLQHLKNSSLQAAPHPSSYAGPEDVACDVCSGRKLKALKSCLQCLASYCQEHLQPHREAAPLMKHKLVDPSIRLQENVCSRHDEVMKLFCRTDQQSICSLCCVDQHRGHDTVSAAAERSQKQRELEGSRLHIQQRIQDREKDVKLLQQELKTINVSADKAVEHSERIFSQLIRLLQERGSDVEQQVRSQQQNEVRRVKKLQGNVEQEITELKRKDAELQKLSHTQDHKQFLHRYPSLSALSGSANSSSINIHPKTYFKDVTAAVSDVRDKLQEALTHTWTNVSQAAAQVDFLPSDLEEPTTRAGFSRYSRGVTLDREEPPTRAASLRWNCRVTPDLEEPTTRAGSSRFSRGVTLDRQEPPTRAASLRWNRRVTPDLEEHRTRAGSSRFSPGVGPDQTEPTTIASSLKFSRGVTLDREDPPTRAALLRCSHRRTPDPAEPTTRAVFLRYSHGVTLDPNTANKQLLLSDGDRKVTYTKQAQPDPHHSDGFTYFPQVLSRESLSGPCYWELEWIGRGVCVAVSEKTISRSGDGSLFGSNDKSWALFCNDNRYTFYHNRVETVLSGPQSSRVGVYLDDRAGILSFYSITETMTLLHRVQTTFTQPLHAGLTLWCNYGDRAEFI